MNAQPQPDMRLIAAPYAKLRAIPWKRWPNGGVP